MSLSSIQSLFNASLQEFAKANGYPVAWENRDFCPLHGVYLRPTLLLGEQRAAALGPYADDFQPGVFQIDIKARCGVGWFDPFFVADQLREHFKRGSRLKNDDTKITIKSTSAGPGINNDARYKLPVSINFYAYMNPA